MPEHAFHYCSQQPAAEVTALGLLLWHSWGGGELSPRRCPSPMLSHEVTMLPPTSNHRPAEPPGQAWSHARINQTTLDAPCETIIVAALLLLHRNTGATACSPRGCNLINLRVQPIPQPACAFFHGQQPPSSPGPPLTRTSPSPSQSGSERDPPCRPQSFLLAAIYPGRDPRRSPICLHPAPWVAHIDFCQKTCVPLTCTMPLLSAHQPARHW